jgi:hypothetical protein
MEWKAVVLYVHQLLESRRESRNETVCEKEADLGLTTADYIISLIEGRLTGLRPVDSLIVLSIGSPE